MFPLCSTILNSTQLTSSCVKADDEMRLLYADCLAELGAIDPGKMVMVPVSHRPDDKVKSKSLGGINSPTFMMEYIEVLVTELLSAETTRVQVLVLYVVLLFSKVLWVCIRVSSVSIEYSLAYCMITTCKI